MCLFRNLVYLWLVLLTARVGYFVNLPIQKTLLGTMHSDWINVIVKHQANTLILFHHCVRKNMTRTCGWNAYMYMYFGFDFFRLEITLKMTVHYLLFPALFFQLAAIQRCVSYISLNQSLFIVLIVLLFWVLEIVLLEWLLWFEQTPVGRGLVLPIVPFAGRLRLTPSARPNLTIPP